MNIDDEKIEKLKKYLKKVKFIAEHYGKERQLVKTMEELAELIQAIAKYHLKPTEENKAAIIEEIADVNIMMIQLDILLQLDEKLIADTIDAKIDRQIARIEHESESA